MEHLAAYLLAGLILVQAFGSYRRAPIVIAFLVILAGALEMVQLWVPGRTFDLGDWEAGSLGAIIGVLLARVSDRTIRKNEQADGLQTRTLEPKDVDMTLCTGDWVEVRSKEEILATLDKNGRLEGLPLMPQMLEQCGTRFQVHKRAHKTCDTVSGHYANRRVPNSIHLGHRCDGKAHGGCQAECLIFWKEAWLKPVGGKPGGCPSEAPPSTDSSAGNLHDRGRVGGNARAGREGRTTAVQLPSDRAVELFAAPQKLGRAAVCRRLSIEECLAAAAVIRVCYSPRFRK